MKTNVKLSKVLTPEELQWFGQRLSKSQMKEGIKSHPRASHSVIFNVLEAARSRVENGLPPNGDLWENPSAEETRSSMIVDVDRTRASVLVHQNEYDRSFQTLILRGRRQGNVLEKQ